MKPKAAELLKQWGFRRGSPTSVASQEKVDSGGFPKLGVPFQGSGPISIWSLHRGPPMCGKYQIAGISTVFLQLGVNSFAFEIFGLGAHITQTIFLG